jgi:putative N6-adenine-specific DNA methylase
LPAFIGLTSKGLRSALSEELISLGVKHTSPQSGGLRFESSWKELYRLGLCSRLANRFLLPLKEFNAYNAADLYSGISKIDFSKRFDVTQTFSIQASVSDHKELRDQRFVTMKVKDAIVDQFREKTGERPDVSKDHPDYRVVVRVKGPEVWVALDLAENSLSHRGYRQKMVEAPLRETLACGILKLTGWNSSVPLVDPMCGSGTLLIEAARMALGLGPQVTPPRFLFENFKGFERDAFLDVKKQVEEFWKSESRKALKERSPRLYGFDRSERAIEAARRNAQAAGVGEWIRFECRSVQDLKNPTSSQEGFIITNPPYGERLSSRREVSDLAHTVSERLKADFKGWQAWILSGGVEWSEGFHLKAKSSTALKNGPLDVRLMGYDIR